MAKIGRLNVQIGVDLARFRNDMNQAFKTLNSSTAQMQRSLSGLKAGFGAVTGAVVALGAALSTGEIIRAADQFNQLQAKVKNSLDTVSQFDSVFKELVASSNRSGSSIDAMAQAFTRLRPAAQELGKSNEDLIRFNETFLKMGALAGATSTEVNNAMIQLSQGLASGALRGDELRSVMEQMPQVARTIADSMGIPFKNFKKAAEDGKISAEAVFKAIIDQSKEVDAQFKTLPASVDRSMNKLTNSFSLLLGSLNEATSMTDLVSKALDFFADIINKTDKFIQNNQATIKFWVRTLLQMGETATQIGGVVFNSIGAIVSAVAWGMTSAVKNALQSIQNLVDNTINSINGVIGLVNNIPGVKIGLLGKVQVPGLDLAKKVNELAYRGMGSFAGNAVNGVGDLFSGKSAFSNLGQGGSPGTAGRRSSGSSGSSGGQGRSGGGGGRHGGKSEAEKEMDRLKQLAEQLHERNMTLWERYKKDVAEATILLKKHRISTEDYNREVERLQEGMSIKFVGVPKIDDPGEGKVFTGMEDWWQKILDAGDRLKESVLTPVEEYRKKVSELDEMLRHGAIGQEDFKRGVQKLKDDAITPILTPLEQYNKELQTIIDLNNAGIIGSEQFERQTQALNDAFIQGTTVFQGLEQFGSSALSTMEDGIINFAKSGKLAFKDMIASMLEDMARLVFQLAVIQPLMNSLFGNKQTGGSGIIGSFLGNLFGAKGAKPAPVGGLVGSTGPMLSNLPKYASGGLISAMQPAIVGEQGPELFLPGRTGTIIPNNALGGGVTLNQYFTIQTIDNRDFEDRLVENAKTIGNLSVRAVQKQQNRMGQRGIMESVR